MKNMSLSAIITVDQKLKQVEATAGTPQTSSGTCLIRDRLPNHATGEVRGQERVMLQRLAQEHSEHARTKLEWDALAARTYMGPPIQFDRNCVSAAKRVNLHGRSE